MIKAVAFDVDGTLVSKNFWIALHELFGVSRGDDASWMESYRSGSIDYREWMNMVSEAFSKNPLPKDAVESLMDQFTLFPGVEGLITRLRTEYPVALVSSNVDRYVEGVARELQIKDWYAFTSFEYSDDGRFSNVGYHGEGNEREAKVDSLKAFAQKYNIEVTDIAFVGDSRNDLDAFTMTGKGILIRDGNEELRNAAWKRVQHIIELDDIL